MAGELVNISAGAARLTASIVLLLLVQAVLRIDAALDPALVAAEKDVKVIKVRKDGSGDFKTVTDAIESVPSGNTKRTIIWIGAGEYREKITVGRDKPFVTFYGPKLNKPVLVYDGTAEKYGTVNSATVIVESDYFMAANIIFKNSAPKPDGRLDGAQAVAMRISGNKAAFYNSKFIGYQDTLCDDKGYHFFQNCIIRGTVDFIFGDGKSLYTETDIHSLGDGESAITAQGRVKADDDSGFAFVHCNITGNGSTYLGRAWKERAKVVFAYTYMGLLVKPEGWSDKGYRSRDKTVFYGEYKCYGPGASTSKRAKYTKIMSSEEAKPYLDKSYINAATWLLPPPELQPKSNSRKLF
ncbi:hypothetical protein Scep_008027 [Stephania cephalantha]|uniref:Pectinesterase n=1 Tax=Stephania cephalantha TaxID=152367 RepID=A0AAP0KC69_9MAGN